MNNNFDFIVEKVPKLKTIEKTKTGIRLIFPNKYYETGSFCLNDRELSIYGIWADKLGNTTADPQKNISFCWEENLDILFIIKGYKENYRLNLVDDLIILEIDNEDGDEIFLDLLSVNYRFSPY